jgi:adenine deaminase
MTINANIVDIFQGTCGYGQCTFSEGRITNTEPSGAVRAGEPFLIPGFVDAHVHIESSMLVPTEFARLAVVHGTVATVSDPHEIANVLGVAGVEYMLENARHSPFKFHFGVPSCVPATAFETAGDVIDAEAVRALLTRNDLSYLAEMMNYPGVLFEDPEVMAKIAAAQDLGKPIDGHAPGVVGDVSTNAAAMCAGGPPSLPWRIAWCRARPSRCATPASGWGRSSIHTPCTPIW